MAKTIPAFTVEKGVPLPAKRWRDRYPLEDLEVGHSFVVPGDHVQGLRMAISQRHRRRGDGKRWTVRKQETGYRCWRTA